MEEKTMSPGHIIKLILKTAFWLFIISVNILIFWRIFSSGDTKTSKKYIWDENSVSAYSENADEFDLSHQTSDTNIDEDGLFALSNTFISKKAGTLQCTVRFNNSTVKKLMQSYNLKEKPTGEIFTFILTDNLGHSYTDFYYIAEKKNVYNYRKLVFNNVDFSNIITTEELKNLNVESVDEDGNVTTAQDPEISQNKLIYFTLKAYYIDDVVLDSPITSLSAFSFEKKYENLKSSALFPKSGKADGRFKKNSVYITQ